MIIVADKWMFTTSATTNGGQFRSVSARSRRKSAGTLRVLHAAGSQLQKRWNNDVVRRAEPVRADERDPTARGSSGKAPIIAAPGAIFTLVLVVRYRQTDGARLRRVPKESGAARLLSGRRRGDKHAQRPRLMTLCRRHVGVPPRGFSCPPGAAKAPHGTPDVWRLVLPFGGKNTQSARGVLCNLSPINIWC